MRTRILMMTAALALGAASCATGHDDDGMGGSAGAGGTGGSGGAPAADAGPKSITPLDGPPTSGMSCSDVQLCSNACVGDVDCVNVCLDKGSMDGREQWTALQACLDTNCGAACGKGGAGGPACHTCNCKVQCTPTGACKGFNETCVGAVPDPDCATHCP